MCKEQQRRKALEKMAKLFATESYYHPYGDKELAEKIGITSQAAGYYRREYFRMGNTVTRRAQYMRIKKEDGTLPLMGLEEATRKTTKKTSKGKR